MPTPIQGKLLKQGTERTNRKSVTQRTVVFYECKTRPLNWTSRHVVSRSFVLVSFICKFQLNVAFALENSISHFLFDGELAAVGVNTELLSFL